MIEIQPTSWVGVRPIFPTELKINSTVDFSKIPWPEDEEYKWRAVDKEGEASFFTDRPNLEEYAGYWDTVGESMYDCFYVEGIDNDILGFWDSSDWENSLEERPNAEEVVA